MVARAVALAPSFAQQCTHTCAYAPTPPHPSTPHPTPPHPTPPHPSTPHRRRALHLFDIASQTRSTLLSFSSYVQWVPDSDVVVAQSRSNLCVWYHIDAPDRVTVVPIKGDVEEIERVPGRTEVSADQRMHPVTYPTPNPNPNPSRSPNPRPTPHQVTVDEGMNTVTYELNEVRSRSE